MYRGQLERKTKQRTDAEKRASEYRKVEADKRSAATKARAAAASTRSPSTQVARLRDAARHEDSANKAGKDVAQWQGKAAKYAKEESDIQLKLMRAEQAEALAAERQRERVRKASERAMASRYASISSEVTAGVREMRIALRELRPPRKERLRVLMLAASSEGDLRVGREQKRIRAAVESSLHRDLIDLDVRTSATSTDLLDGIVRFRPHIVHFSGHSDDDLIVFEDNLDYWHSGVIVSAESFASAIAATDEPPLLVFLNSCNSARQADRITQSVAPFAIGMSAEIGDIDAITYAAQFYSAVANGQSIESAHLSGQAALRLAGLDGSDLPVLACANDVDPRLAVLVTGLDEIGDSP